MDIFPVIGLSRRHAEETTDEIALNPATFHDRTAEEILSTLVHEMVHLWQHHFGTPSRASYHNREWAAKMKERSRRDRKSIGGSSRKMRTMQSAV